MSVSKRIEKYTSLMKRILYVICSGVGALIMLQTLWFKFQAKEESVYIFTELGIEPWGRIATGVAELIASILLLIPRTSSLGSFLGIGLMAGAIFFHLTGVGIVVMNDGGLLFGLAVLTFFCCLVVFVIKFNSFRATLLRLLGCSSTTLG